MTEAEAWVWSLLNIEQRPLIWKLVELENQRIDNAMFCGTLLTAKEQDSK